MKKSVIMFDFDGVIVDSTKICYNANKDLLPQLQFSEWQSWSEGNVHSTLPKELNNKEAVKNFYIKYAAGLVNILPVVGIHKTIKTLAKKHDLFIVSSSQENSINNFLNKHQLSQYFQEVLGTETNHSKVEKINDILRRHMIKPSEALLITDTTGDIKEAAETGIGTLGVVWGVHNEKKLTETNPHFIAATPEDIIIGVETILS